MPQAALKSKRPARDMLLEQGTLDALPDAELQAYLLQHVSRTFALTIPQLPEPLAHAVSNAYLLCRIVDTVEDDPGLSAEEKERYCTQFINVVRGSEDAANFAHEVALLLTEATPEAEHILIRYTPRVIALTHALDRPQRVALENCVKIMAEGMAFFQDKDTGEGLENLAELDRYCYYVAGVVGEMLTELFVHYSPQIEQHRDTMMSLAVSFGQGLQMTNILKDVWEDQERSACWLPKDIFEAVGFDLKHLKDGSDREQFAQGLEVLIGVAHGHLRNALSYTLHIPREETGMRNFCLWALGMAVLTLGKIHKNHEFTAGKQVKISRRSVKATVLSTRLSGKYDFLLKALFSAASIGVPTREIRLSDICSSKWG